MKAMAIINNTPPTAIDRLNISAMEDSHTGTRCVFEMLAGNLLDAQVSTKIPVVIQYHLLQVTVSNPFNTLSIRV